MQRGIETNINVVERWVGVIKEAEQIDVLVRFGANQVLFVCTAADHWLVNSDMQLS